MSYICIFSLNFQTQGVRKMKLVKSVLVAMLLGIMAIQVAWAEEMTRAEKARLEMESIGLIQQTERGDLDEIKLQLSKGADINAKVAFAGSDRDIEYTALMRAVMHGYFDIVKYLVAKGADVNENYGYTALMEATKCSNIRFIFGGHVSECKRGDKKCFKEKYSGCLKRMKYLVEKGADVNAKSSKHGETALMMAPSLEIVKYLISKGADINATDKYGKNALMRHLGGYPEDLEIVKALVGGKGGFLSLFKKSNGVDVNAKDNKGKTALMYAESLEVIKYLLSKGADINAKDNEGKTALMGARSLDAIKYLLSKGADINAKDNEGKSVFDYARSGEVAEFLLSKGAKR